MNKAVSNLENLDAGTHYGEFDLKIESTMGKQATMMHDTLATTQHLAVSNFDIEVILQKRLLRQMQSAK